MPIQIPPPNNPLPTIHSFDEELGLSYSVQDDKDSEVVDLLYNEILDHHRCKQCTRFLCCGGVLTHLDPCWAENYRGDLTVDDVTSIHKYRWSMISYHLSDYDEELRSQPNQCDLLNYRYRVARCGFYVRCMICNVCTRNDRKMCHTQYHNHFV